MGLLNFIKKPPPGSQAPAPEQQKYTVLVVDDEQYLREFYQELLTRNGYQVLTASNGQEALTTVSQTTPHLILLDIMMPVMDGMEVLKNLWENNLTKKIPVIVLTNAGDLNNMDKAKFYSTYKFLIKSNVAPEEILKEVNDAIQSTVNTNQVL